jgi:hypothetical protein
VTIYDHAREWLLECYPDPDDEEIILALTDEEAGLRVAAEYEGGWMAFLEDMAGWF